MPLLQAYWCAQAALHACGWFLTFTGALPMPPSQALLRSAQFLAAMCAVGAGLEGIMWAAYSKAHAQAHSARTFKPTAPAAATAHMQAAGSRPEGGALPEPPTQTTSTETAVGEAGRSSSSSSRCRSESVIHHSEQSAYYATSPPSASTPPTPALALNLLSHLQLPPTPQTQRPSPLYHSRVRSTTHEAKVSWRVLVCCMVAGAFEHPR